MAHADRASSRPFVVGCTGRRARRRPGCSSCWPPVLPDLAPTHRSALRPRCGDLRGLRAPTDLEITVPARRGARLDGVVVHESAVEGPRHVAMLERIPVSSVARTLCDLTAVVRDWRVERAVDEALRRKLVTLRALAAVAEELAGRGRRRCTVIRDILEHRHPGTTRARALRSDASPICWPSRAPDADVPAPR